MAAPRIGLACPSPGERAAFMQWCTSANFRVLPMIDAASIARELAGDGFEALVIDAALAVSGDTPMLLRNLGRNRPVLVLGDGPRAPGELLRRDVTYLERPLTREQLVFAITLALAEGRPARRWPRRLVSRLHASVEGTPARLIDVSNEGVRLEMRERHRAKLPPILSIAVPTFDVVVVGKRVWVNNLREQNPERVFWCGVRLERNPDRALSRWRTLVENAPASTILSSNLG